MKLTGRGDRSLWGGLGCVKLHSPRCRGPQFWCGGPHGWLDGGWDWFGHSSCEQKRQRGGAALWFRRGAWCRWWLMSRAGNWNMRLDWSCRSWHSWWCMKYGKRCERPAGACQKFSSVILCSTFYNLHTGDTCPHVPGQRHVVWTDAGVFWGMSAHLRSTQTHEFTARHLAPISTCSGEEDGFWI